MPYMDILGFCINNILFDIFMYSRSAFSLNLTHYHGGKKGNNDNGLTLAGRTRTVFYTFNILAF